MKRRIAAWMMAVCMVICMVPSAALAEDVIPDAAENTTASAGQVPEPGDAASVSSETDEQTAEIQVEAQEAEVVALASSVPGVTVYSGRPTKIDLSKVTATGSGAILITANGLKVGGTACESRKNSYGYEFTGTNDNVGVKVDENVETTLILNNVTMEGSRKVIYFDVSLARTTMVLKGNNRLVANGGYGSGCIRKDGIDNNKYNPGAPYTPYNTYLKIKAEDPSNPGKLYCKANYHSVVLGASYSGSGRTSQETCGFCNLTIESGDIELEAVDHTPALGANCYYGYSRWNYTENVKILGGTVRAKGGSDCAAIGSGYCSPVYDLTIGGTADVTAYGGSGSPAIGSGGGSGGQNDVKNITIDVTNGARLNLYGDKDSEWPAIGIGKGQVGNLENIKVISNDKDKQAFVIYGKDENDYKFDQNMVGVSGSYNMGNYLNDQKEKGKLVYYVGIYSDEAKDNWQVFGDGKILAAINNVVQKTGGKAFTVEEINALTSPIYKLVGESEKHGVDEFTINTTQLDAINYAKVRNQTGEFDLTYTATATITEKDKDGKVTSSKDITFSITSKVSLLENATSSGKTDSMLKLGANDAHLPTGTQYTVDTLRDKTFAAGVNADGSPAKKENISVTSTSLDALNMAARKGKLGDYQVTFTYKDPKTNENISVTSTITLQKNVTYEFAAADDSRSQQYKTTLTTLLNNAGLTAPTDGKLYSNGDPITVAAPPSKTILEDTAHNGKWIFTGYYSGNTKLGSSVLMSEDINKFVGKWVFTGDKLAVVYQGKNIASQTTKDLKPDDPTPKYKGSIPTVSGFVFGGWSPAVAEKIAYDQINGVTGTGADTQGAIIYTAIWRTAGTVVPPKVTGTTAYTVTVDGTPGQEYSIDGGKTWVLPGNYPLDGKPEREKKVIFTGLTPNTDYTVLTRLPAKDGNSPSETKQAPAHTVKYDAPQLADMFKGPGDATEGDDTNPPYDQAKNESVHVIVDEDGNYEIVVDEDIHRTIPLPTDLGDVDLDLNGHIIKGDDGTPDSPDGKPGVKFHHPTDGNPGPDSDLTVEDNSEEGGGEIIGGDGYTPKPGDPDNVKPGNGGDGVNAPDPKTPEDPDNPGTPGNPDTPDTPDTPDKPDDPAPKITVGPGAIIKGGDGGDGKPPKTPADPANPPADDPDDDPGDGGPGIKGGIDVIIDGGDVGGGDGGDPDPDKPGGKPGNPGKKTDTPNPPVIIGDGPTQYTLTFEVDGGTPLSPVTRLAGTTVRLDGYMTYKEGFTFEGWYLDEACTQPVSRVKLDKNITVYAKWRANILTDLNSEDHFAYIVGYTDGTVRPKNGISRAETATVFYRLLIPHRRSEIFTAENSFNDVVKGNWYNKAVSSMARGGYILGYPDGGFHGSKWITRAEFAAILVRFMGVDETAQATFADVSPSHWAYHHIATAQKNGYMVGYNGNFRPNDYISRAEAMTTLNRILSRGIDAESETDGARQWPDNPEGAWYYYEVIEATNDHDHAGIRPSEDWPSLEIDYYYDIKYYEWP